MIIVVGNSNKLIGLKLGHLIDKFDLVIRFNLYSVDNIYKEDLGVKTDIHAISYSSKGIIGFWKQKIKKRILADCRNMIKNKKIDPDISIISYEFLQQYKEKYKFKKNLSSGFSVILYYLFYLKHEQIYITNFDFFCTGKKTHYYTNKTYAGFNDHEFQKEREIVEQFILEGKVVVLEDTIAKINN